MNIKYLKIIKYSNCTKEMNFILFFNLGILWPIDTPSSLVNNEKYIIYNYIYSKKLEYILLNLYDNKYYNITLYQNYILCKKKKIFILFF
jgi:hypothetical protein